MATFKENPDFLCWKKIEYKNSVVKKVNLGDFSWTLYNDYLFYTSNTSIQSSSSYSPVCTHFIGTTDTNIANRINFLSNSSHLNIVPDSNFTQEYNTPALFKQWLADNNVVELDEERKAAMVSNLLVVLCADEAAQPVVNTGTLHN